MLYARRVYYPPAQVKSYQTFRENGVIFQVVNPDGVIAQTGKVIDIDEDLLHLDEIALQVKVMLLREQIKSIGFTPVE